MVAVVEPVTGVPPPVSVAVVPVLEGCSVSVEPTVVSVGLRWQANATTSRATTKAFLISKRQSGTRAHELGVTRESLTQARCCMPQVVGRFTGPAFAIMRIVVGLMFMLHGTQKILGTPPMEGMNRAQLPAIAVVGGWIALVCRGRIVIGLFGGLAAFIASGEMAVAYFMGHASHGPTPLQNKGELAVVYCFV